MIAFTQIYIFGNNKSWPHYFERLYARMTHANWSLY